MLKRNFPRSSHQFKCNRIGATIIWNQGYSHNIFFYFFILFYFVVVVIIIIIIIIIIIVIIIIIIIIIMENSLEWH